MPSNLTLFLTRDEVLEIHNKLILRFGGKSGTRDLGLLESALYRPKTGYYDNLPEMATALFESLIISRPFIDGNKCVAFFSTDVFLRINGFKFKVNSQEAHTFLISLLESGTCSYEKLLPWIRKKIVSL